jgi:hypothetical protein
LGSILVVLKAIENSCVNGLANLTAAQQKLKEINKNNQGHDAHLGFSALVSL